MNSRFFPSPSLALRVTAFCAAFQLATEFSLEVHADLTYTSDGQRIIITGSEPKASGDLSIPPTIASLPVTAIADYAFYRSIDLVSVKFPPGVTSIGAQAFYGCSRLTQVDMPKSLTDIGNNAFNSCWGLTQITLPSGLRTISDSTFRHCSSLTSVTIPNSVTTIGDEAFFGCSSLTSAVLGSGIISINSSAFRNCGNLLSFICDPSNASYSSIDGVFYNKSQSMLIRYPQNRAGSFTVPNTVRFIANEAFMLCTNLFSVTIPRNVISLGVDEKTRTSEFYGGWAFSGCSSLTNVTIGDGVRYIGKNTFAGCGNLSHLSLGNGVIDIDDEAFYDSPNLVQVTFGSAITHIGAFAFYNATQVEGLYFFGDKPSLGLRVFGDGGGLVYYRPEKVGWGTSFAGRPTATWIESNPSQHTDTIVLESSTQLENPSWNPIATNTINRTQPQRYYRLRAY